MNKDQVPQQNEQLVPNISGLFQKILTNVPTSQDAKDVQAFHRLSALTLITLKTLMKKLHLELDGQRKSLETKKLTIDQLQLQYENLLYRKAHLEREISACKSIPTPNITAIEKELGYSICAKSYSDDLSLSANHSSFQKLQEEQSIRIATKRTFDDYQSEYQVLTEKLEKKRKFLKELPEKVATIKAYASSLMVDFTAFPSESNNPITSPTSNE